MWKVYSQCVNFSYFENILTSKKFVDRCESCLLAVVRTLLTLKPHLSAYQPYMEFFWLVRVAHYGLRLCC